VRALSSTPSHNSAPGAEGDRSGHRQAIRHGEGRRCDVRQARRAIADDKQSAHIKITGSFRDPGYKAMGDELVFDRVMYGLRNTVLLPAGWDVSALSQSGTIGTYEGRTFVSLLNLNGENNYRLTLRARKRS
jgi:hypothetical protein